MDASVVNRPRNIRIVIEYDGENYVGWEKQKNGLGIQDVIESAIAKITQEKTTLNGSGRTDAGVHAEGQVASFTLQHRMATKDLHRALNAVLPEDIAILELSEVSLFFHARFSALSKTYRYSILQGRIHAPLKRRRSYQVYRDLDLEPMQRAAKLLEGQHDFSAFCKEAERIGDCTRRVQEISIREEDGLLNFYLSADGFLYNMVRILVGTLIYVGQGKTSVEQLQTLLENPEDLGLDFRREQNRAPTLPARALCLVEVIYPVDEFAPSGDSSSTTA